jgi:hypothetical protein
MSAQDIVSSGAAALRGEKHGKAGRAWRGLKGKKKDKAKQAKARSKSQRAAAQAAKKPKDKKQKRISEGTWTLMGRGVSYEEARDLSEYGESVRGRKSVSPPEIDKALSVIAKNSKKKNKGKNK